MDCHSMCEKLLKFNNQTAPNTKTAQTAQTLQNNISKNIQSAERELYDLTHPPIWRHASEKSQIFKT